MRDFSQVGSSFDTNAQFVFDLLEFDRFIIEHVVGGLNQLANDLAEQGRNNAATTVSNRVAALQLIQHSDSLRPRYVTIFNQCVVLLVSYFGSAVHKLFLESAALALRAGWSVPASSQELKVSFRELQSKDEDVAIVFVGLLIAQKDVSFQDMQSIRRAFKDYLGIDVPKTDETHDLILGQAARHVIVHAGGLVDARMIRQVAASTPRTLKLHLNSGEPIQFDPGEVRQLGSAMSRYLRTLIDLVHQRFDALRGA